MRRNEDNGSFMDKDGEIDFVVSCATSQAIGQAVASASQNVESVECVCPGCERCFICFNFVSSPHTLLVCSNMSPDRDGHMVRCSVGYCRSCISRHKEAVFLCAIHQKRPAQTSNMFARQKCWGCPPGTDPALLRHCGFCGKEYCHVCGLFGEKNLKNPAYKYVCPGCRDDPESLATEVETRLTELLRQAVNIKSIDIHRFSLSQVKTEQIDFDALDALLNAAYDVHQEGFHKMAEPFLKAVLDMDVRSAHCLRSRARIKVVTHPSQHLRMFSGSQETRRVHKILSMAVASDLVARNHSDSSDRGQSPCWAPHRKAHWQAAPDEDGLPTAFIWMHDCSFCSPTVSLVSHQFTELSKSGMFSSVVLCGRKVSKNEPYHSDDGAVAKLIRHFESTRNLMLFEPGATDAEIAAFFHDAKADIVVDCTGYSFGGIPHILAGLTTAVKIAYIGYPGAHFGIYDFSVTAENLLNREIMQSPDRERFIIMDRMYPSVGYHNGHHDTRKDWEDKLVVPEDHRPLLVFLGDGSKIREEGLHVWLDIMAATGDGPESALLMLLHSSEPVMQQVERWLAKYNHEREGTDVIMPGRIRWFPYRSKQELWGWCGKIRGRAVSISCPGAPYDVHTLCSDALWAALVHLGLRTPGQDWPTLVAPSLLDGAGLGEMFIANSDEDFKAKGTMLALVSSQPFLRAASEHLDRCRNEGIGHFNIEQPVLNMGRGLTRAWKEFHKPLGEGGKLDDIDLTKLYPVLETRVFAPHPAAADSISESGADQALRVCNQLQQTHAKGLALCRHALQRALHLHHRIGLRNMTLEGVGSTTICVHAKMGSGDYAIKITHCFNGKGRQEDHLATDANFKAVLCARKAGARKAGSAGLLQPPIEKLMLPEIFCMYQHGACPIAVVDGSVGALPDQAKNSGNSKAKNQGTTGTKVKTRAQSRPVITCIVCEFVPGGTLSNHEELQRLVLEYRNEGNISVDVTGIVQAILQSVHSLNKEGIANFDLSYNNVALRKIGHSPAHRWIAVWIDTGTSVVFDDSLQAPHALPTPSIPKYVNGVRYVTGEQVDATFGDSRTRQQLTCWGTDTQRDEEFFEHLKADSITASIELRSEKLRSLEAEVGTTDRIEALQGAAKSMKTQQIELTLEDGMRCDSFSVSLIVVQVFHPAPKDKSGREQWKRELSVARDSSDNMFTFLSAGLNAGVSVKQPDMLSVFANVLYDLLRKDWKDRIPVHEAIRRLGFTSD